MNTSGGFRLFGASESDLQFLIDTCDLRLKEGRSLRPRTNELLLSEELADALGLRIGDRIGRSINEDYYWVIPTTMELVGILESTPSTDAGQRIIAGFVSYEYVDSHELYTPRSSLLVVAQTGRKAEVDRFLETTIASPRADVMTYDRLSESLSQGLLYFHVIFGVVDCLAATVIALVVGTINWIGVTQRIEDGCRVDRGSGVFVAALCLAKGQRLSPHHGAESDEPDAHLVLRPDSAGGDRVCDVQHYADIGTLRRSDHH